MRVLLLAVLLGGVGLAQTAEYGQFTIESGPDGASYSADLAGVRHGPEAAPEQLLYDADVYSVTAASPDVMLLTGFASVGWRVIAVVQDGPRRVFYLQRLPE